ncbi:hypothetical protein FQA39_LY08849 [Lamprigera yunnana]|nr:hypothetical protein FQA39_LY08849 [Lamprigera yunnana]
MDSHIEMDLTMRSRDGVPPDACKMRVAKSIFSIRSLVDLGDAADKTERDSEDGRILNEGEVGRVTWIQNYTETHGRKRHRKVVSEVPGVTWITAAAQCVGAKIFPFQHYLPARRTLSIC